MSVESAKAFIDRMKSGVEFARKVKACKDSKERRTFVKDAGFDFTAAECKVLMLLPLNTMKSVRSLAN